MKKKSITISITIIVAMLAIFFVRWKVMNGERSVTVNRIFVEPNTDQFQTIKLPATFSKILSISDSFVLLKNDFKTISILKSKNNNKWTDRNIYNIFSDAKLEHIEEIVLRSQDNVIFSGNTGYIYFVSNFTPQSFSKKIDLGFKYSQGIIAPNNIAFFRGLDSTGKNSIFFKYDCNTNEVSDSVHVWPPNLNDAGLASDGIFLFDLNKSLYYINYYNSDVYCFDTSLNKVFLFNTIDSISFLPHIVYNSVERSYKFASPHRIINNAATVNLQYLYINSIVKTQNESLNHRKDHVIDVYEINNRKYSFSFHIPAKYGWEIEDMKLIDKNRLAILTEKNLVILREME